MNEKINIQNLTDLLVEKHGMEPEHAGDFVKAFFTLIEEGLEQDKYVKVKGLGTFKLIEVDSRESIDVNTGERIEIQGHNKISFTPDTALKEIINRPFAHFETVVLNENVQFDDTPVKKDNGDDFDGEAETDMTSSQEVQQPKTVAMPAEEEQTVDERPKDEQLCGEEPAENRPAEPENVKEKEPETPAEEPKEAVAPKTEEIPVTSHPELEPKPETEPAVDAETTPNNNRTSGKASKWLAGIVVFILMACGGVVGYLYLPDMQEADGQHNEPAVEEGISVTPPRIATDTIAPVKTDTVNSTEVTAGKEQAEKTPVQPKKERRPAANGQVTEKNNAKKGQPFVPDSVNYEIEGTRTEYTIQEGETLTRVSLKFYGTKALWPYLVKHNAKILKNPNNVPSGTTIRIPKLVKKR